MQEIYYINGDGTLDREDNTLHIKSANGDKRRLPVENMSGIIAVNTNIAITGSAALLAAKLGIQIIFTDYLDQSLARIESYKEKTSGDIVLAQAKHRLNFQKRLTLAKTFVDGGAENIKRILLYHRRRNEPTISIEKIEEAQKEAQNATTIEELMAHEGAIRKQYYAQLDLILPQEWKLDGREYKPTKNIGNALMSFLNTLTYSACSQEIATTNLCPAIAFLHETNNRRNSLALDISEIFKPLLSDTTLLTITRLKMLKQEDFETDTRLSKEGRRVVLDTWSNKLHESHFHTILNRNVSWREEIRIECYKIIKHVLDIEEYKPIKLRQ